MINVWWLLRETVEDVNQPILLNPLSMAQPRQNRAIPEIFAKIIRSIIRKSATDYEQPITLQPTANRDTN